MKRIALLTTLGLALFATATLAHEYRGQHNSGHAGTSRIHHNGNMASHCRMNSGMRRWGMMNHNAMHRRMDGTAMSGTANSWRADPSYQGQVAADTSVE
ncbi:MAG: hypothetical protein DSY58_01800 [Desulfobulbus sp.]|nr:MAG: hypothetical protein DSY58_01800 [Desulfobulbus sp.]RUM41621.1 MAG: hypothetical protein DSY70_00975 [Desulfobulbus sp.]